MEEVKKHKHFNDTIIFNDNQKWWKEAIGYQIYIRSFYDSNNDGIGDIRGIINKLDYLEYLGVNLLWICPFYKSPMDDNGYDVSDFLDVSNEYGTMDDIKELIQKAHEKKIRIIIDLILNQTSDEHKWFIEAKKSIDNPYHDYYIWQNPRYKDGQMIEPTNWASFFGGSCWEYCKDVNQYYMKIFSKKMPDLNWKNENVQKEIIEIIKYWCNLGIDGFRLDAVAHLSKSEFTDSDMECNEKYKPDWSRYSNLPKVHEYLNLLYREAFSKYDILTVGEVGGNATVEDALLYTKPSRNEVNMVFNFDHNWCNNKWEKKKDEKLRIKVLNLKQIFNKWEVGLQKADSWNAIYWLNHDQPRVASHYGDKEYFNESTKVLAMALYFMWGTPFIYNGEEIGMTNPVFKTIDDFRDVSIKNCYRINVIENKMDAREYIDDVSYSTRDNARTLMQWSKEKNGGFSKGKPWNIICDNYQEINVDSQINNENSLLNFYRKIIDIRLHSEYKRCIIYGKYEQLAIDDERIYAYRRILGDKEIIVICNLTDSKIEDLDLINNYIQEEYKIILTNYVRKELTKQLLPFEGIVLGR